MAEARAWITETDGMTVGQLRRFLKQLPDDAHLEDGDSKVLTSVEAVWEIGQ